MEMDYTVATDKSFDEAVDAVIASAGERGFTVQFVHDVAETLEKKGFPRERVTIVEMCNAKHASRVLAEDVKIGLLLPCPVLVYAERGSVCISTMRPTLIAQFFPDADIADTAVEVEQQMIDIIDSAA